MPSTPSKSKYTYISSSTDTSSSNNNIESSSPKDNSPNYSLKEGDLIVNTIENKDRDDKLSSYNSTKASTTTIEGSDIIQFIEVNKPFSEGYLKALVNNSKEELLSGSIIKYLIDIKILICFKCKIILNPKESKVLEHLKVKSIFFLGFSRSTNYL